MVKKPSLIGRPQTLSTVHGPSLSFILLRSYVLLICSLLYFPHRHLAETWASTYLPPHPKRRLISASSPSTPLSTIEHLVLLDLLGAPHPQVRSYFPDTAWLFDVLASAEMRLRDAGILDATTLGRSFFHSRAAGDINLAYMGDDHLPFLHRGVSVLHVIAEPFPHVWHTLGVSVCNVHQRWRTHVPSSHAPHWFNCW